MLVDLTSPPEITDSPRFRGLESLMKVLISCTVRAQISDNLRDRIKDIIAANDTRIVLQGVIAGLQERTTEILLSVPVELWNVISVLVYSYSGLASLCSVYRRLKDPIGGPLPLQRFLSGCLRPRFSPFSALFINFPNPTPACYCQIYETF